MKAIARSLLVIPIAALLVLGPPGVVFSQQPSAQLPPGHPPLGAAEDPGQPPLPQGHPPITGPGAQSPPDEHDHDHDHDGESEPDNMALPPGHPPIGGSGAPSGAAPSNMSGRPGSPVFDDPTLKPGSLVLQIRDGRGQPVKGLELVLQVTRKTIAGGESRSEKTARVDSDGLAKFDGLQFGSEWSYQAQLKYASIGYSSPAFQLSPAAGKRVTVVVFDTTTDMDAPPVGLQAYVALEPREEFLQIEQIFRFANLGDRTWIIPETIVQLDRGFQAFVVSEEGAELRVEQVEGRGYRLAGFVRPGPHEVSFRYQIPYSNADSIHFSVGLPPRVALLRVISSTTGTTRMRVDGFPEPVVSKGNDGQRLLITERSVAPGSDQIELAGITVQGLPTPGPARWYALALAVTAILAGLYVTLRARGSATPANDPDLRGDVDRAKKLVLEEMASLETARASGEMGPKTYEHSRRALIDSLCRLLAIEKTIGSAVRS